MDDDHLIGLSGFGNRLREERERLGMSQADAASRAGVRRQMWGKYERDEAIPGVDVVAHFCSHGADILYLTTGKRAADQPYRPPIKIELFAQVVAAVDAELACRKCDLEPERRGRFYTSLYEMSLQDGVVNERAISPLADIVCPPKS